LGLRAFANISAYHLVAENGGFFRRSAMPLPLLSDTEID
jgi:hypothetical protein